MDEELMTTNGDDEDINLALALGSANYRVQTKSNSSSGAGVNANLNVDMAFAASDPISELVWSPQRGLSLKTACSNFADRKPFLLWNVGPSNQVLPPPQNIGSIRMGEEVVIDDEMLMLSHSILDADSKLDDKNIHEVDKAASTPMFPGILEFGGEEGLIEGPGTTPVMCCDLNINDLNATDADPNVTKSPSDANARFIMELNDKGTLVSGGMSHNEGEMLDSKHVPPMLSLELSAKNKECDLMAKENRSLGETRFPLESSLPNEESQTNDNICLHNRGKGKASPEGGIYKQTSNHDNESNESVESCSSVGLISRGDKRKNYDQSLIIESKRMKKSFQGSHGSASDIKPNSSFINWISNMVKGASDSYKEESSDLDLTFACTNAKQVMDDQEAFDCNRTHDSPGLSRGFQTIFQSLYHGMNEVSVIKPREKNSFVQESKEFMVTDKASPDKSAEPRRGDDGNSCKEIVVSNETASPLKSRVLLEDLAYIPNACEPKFGENNDTDILAFNSTAENPGLNFPMALGITPGKSNYLTSFWLTRPSTRIQQLEIPAASVDCRFTYKPEHEFPSPKLGKSEAIASLFSRSLGALKHIKPSKSELKFSWTCFFCGRYGHDLRKCSEVTEAELESLLLRISSYGRIEESQRLCLKCFKSDHWAISCSSASSNVHGQSGQNVSTSNHYASIRPQSCFSEEPCLDSVPCDLTCNVTESSGRRAFKSNHIQNKNLPLLNIFYAQNVHVPLDIFYAIKKLRLSRADILRWMNCHVTLGQLNGFFLRLRIGKLESGSGGTAYYVARITESTDGRSKKSILADVGGIKSSVGSQYISNHDFLEDEIKAWWYRILKTGNKFPSLDELNSKFIDRESLGV